MNKNYVLILGLLISVLLITGCTQTQGQGVDTTPSDTGSEVGPDTGGVTAGDEVSFKVEMTYQGETAQMEFKARNLDSETPDFKITSVDGSEAIILGSEEKGWYQYLTLDDELAWDSVTSIYSWDTVWEQYYTNSFLSYYNLVLQAEGSEYSTSGETGSVRVYDINWNPNLPDSTFEDPTN